MLLDLANELLIHIYESCTCVIDVINLSLTCHRLHRLLPTSQRLPVLFLAAEAEFGPLEDIIQLVTWNASQPAPSIRSAPISYPLMRQIVRVGRVAQKWEKIYPWIKWRDNFADRRLLSPRERRLLRRAIYRLWLYTQAFHTRLYPRTTRLIRPIILERAGLLHNWSTRELAEIEDFRTITREIIQKNICPSNGHVQRKIRSAFPTLDPHTYYNHRSAINLIPTEQDEYFFSSHKTIGTDVTLTRLNSALWHDLPVEGWGDEIFHFYVVEDMLKLDPAQVLWLHENAHLKWQVEAFTKGLGDWFDNNGETFGQTLEWVMDERGEDVDEIRKAIVEEVMGIVTISTRLQ